MKLSIVTRLLSLLGISAGLLALGLWWHADHATDTHAGDVPPLTHRDKPVRQPVARIPEHSAYRDLVQRKTPQGRGLEEVEVGVAERVRMIRQQRGGTLAPAERELALDILSGKVVVEGVSGGQFHWLADEILTSLRLQDPAQPDLGKSLAAIAAAATTDPVVRDYIAQHLGHLWEQRGSDPQKTLALWAAVDSPDDTTPGSALIALRNGYQCDGDPENLARVREKALVIARDDSASLAARATALGIAGEDGSPDARSLAVRLLGKGDTPIILRRIAEAIIRRETTVQR